MPDRRAIARQWAIQHHDAIHMAEAALAIYQGVLDE
jgi:hypothetical protein